MKKLAFSLVLVLGLALTMAFNANAQGPVTVQLAFLVDGSGSISGSEFQVMLNGIGDAVANPACVPHNGSVELTVIQFSSSAQTELGGPRVIDSGSAENLANEIRAIRRNSGGTNYEAGFNLAIGAVQGSANFGNARQVINITTDGAPTSGQTDPMVLRDNAVANGFDEIDAEGIGVRGSGITVLQHLVYPQPGTLHPPEAWPPSASGWVRLVANVDEFAKTVCQKFQVTTGPNPLPAPAPNPPTPTPPEPIPEPATIALLGGGAAALAGYLRKRRGGSEEEEEDVIE